MASPASIESDAAASKSESESIERPVTVDPAPPLRRSNRLIKMAESPAAKRALDDDHQPAISSPLNPDLKVKEEGRERAPRAKKDTLKKREAKAGSLAPEGSGRGTPDPKASSSKGKKNDNELAPMRYKLPLPKATDFEAPRAPIWVVHHTKTASDGTEIEYNEDPDQ